MGEIMNYSSLLRGAGQVMFMGNVLTGAMFLVGITIGSWMSGTAVVAVGAVMGLLVSTIAAHLCYKRKDEGESCQKTEDGEHGLHGFNGILIGCALPTFFENSWPMWLALGILSALSPFVRKAMNRPLKALGINSLTFPFIALTWISFCLALSPAECGTHPLSILDSQLSIVTSAWLNGISQVFLVNSPVCGALFLVGLLVADRRAAVWCAVGSALGLVLAFLFGQDSSAIANGLYGFNPALTAIALGTVVNRGTIITIAAILATFFVQLALSWLLSNIGLPSLTAPFCIVTWLFTLPSITHTTDW